MTAVDLRQRQRAADRGIRCEQAGGVIDLREQQRQDVRVRGACAHVAGQRQFMMSLRPSRCSRGVRI